MKFYNFLAIVLLNLFIILPSHSHAFLDADKTGGMSEIYINGTRIKVEGAFIEWYEKDDISIRSKGVEVSLNIDNSQSEKDKNFDIIVSNINPGITEVIGWAGGEIKKEVNKLVLPVSVKSKKIAVYKLAPKRADDNFKFMVFGESRGGENVFKRILGDINYRKPAFAISCGDMVENASAGAYKNFIKDIETVTVPFLTVPGSAEVGEGGGSLYEDNFGATYYSFDYKKAHFIILDNGDGRISEEQFLWLEKDLMQNKAVNTFVFMHLPPFDPRPGRPGLMKVAGQNQRLSSLFEKYHVSIVFTSGIHSYFKEEVKGVTYIVTGGGGSELASTDSFYNYLIVEVTGDKVKDKLIKLTAPPVSWYSTLFYKVKVYVKNSFQTHPVKSFFLSIVLLIILSVIFRLFFERFFKPGKKRRISI
ncbi:MAG: hypothetical protein OEV42_16255 [Deltaproteobacteria bacterium]|nr:hypothetical protein [Deltaproteobacteria bacterium]